MGDPDQLDPVDAFYATLQDLFDLDGRGVFGRLHTYGATRDEPVALKQSTVRGWLKGRRVLPAPDQIAAMVEYFQKRKVLDEEATPELRELWEAASRHRNGTRNVPRTPSAQEAEPSQTREERPAAPVKREEPAQRPGMRRRRRIRLRRWIGIGGYVSAAFSLPILVMQILPWMGRGETAEPSSSHASGTQKHAPETQKKVSSPSETGYKEYTATVEEPSLCSTVIKLPARVYIAPAPDAKVVESLPLNAKVLVFDHTGPQGWRFVYTPEESSQFNWMKAKALTSPAPACQG